jgi:hypothetical protein
MAYNNFTLTKLKKDFGLDQDKIELFKGVADISPSERLTLDIEEGSQMPRNTEKARSENLVSPILKELYRRNKTKMTLFPGYDLNVDKKKGLNGNCDCIIAKRANLMELTNPIICLVEAKNGVIEDGYGQCGAEMYAARLYNEDLGTPVPEMFGIVTNGEVWQFMMLKEQIIYFEADTFSLHKLPRILGILQHIVDKN